MDRSKNAAPAASILAVVTGLAHSGSTLLGLLLTAQPLVCNVGEIRGLAYWAEENRACSCGRWGRPDGRSAMAAMPQNYERLRIPRMRGLDYGD
ncbi:MAG: hypothetical protein BIFFINMI_00193 [Phycisphaerae bacterium]|nr:hypothetical protein [Phycisphaerae bacterium]